MSCPDGFSDPTGTCWLRFRTESLNWPAHTLGATGPNFVIQGPPELFEHLLTWADRFTLAIKTQDACLA